MENIQIPPAFLRTLTFDEFSALCDNGGYPSRIRSSTLMSSCKLLGGTPCRSVMRHSRAHCSALRFSPRTRQQHRAAQRRK